MSLQEVIEILCDEKIIFKAEICELGEDTNFECIEFNLGSVGYHSFDYYLDTDIHGHTICGGRNQWFYSPKNRQEFVEFLKTVHITGEK